MADWLKRLYCGLAHPGGLKVIQEFPLGNGCWRGQCLKCGTEWAVNPTLRTALPWDEQFAAFYRDQGFDIVQTTSTTGHDG